MEVIFNIKFNFNNKMAFTFRLRHYRSKVNYFNLKHLKTDGITEELSYATKNPDINVNLFNIEMNDTWQTGPRSFININCKTATELYNKMVYDSYYYNFKKTLDSPQQVSFSLKIIYYLDYLTLKGKGKGKKEKN